MYAYSVFLADVDTYGIYFQDLWEKMHDIRSKAEYKGKYAYRGADQNCLFVPPEVDPTGVGMTMSALWEPELVASFPHPSVSSRWHCSLLCNNLTVLVNNWGWQDEGGMV